MEGCERGVDEGFELGVDEEKAVLEGVVLSLEPGEDGFRVGL